MVGESIAGVFDVENVYIIEMSICIHSEQQSQTTLHTFLSLSTLSIFKRHNFVPKKPIQVSWEEIEFLYQISM